MEESLSTSPLLSLLDKPCELVEALLSRALTLSQLKSGSNSSSGGGSGSGEPGTPRGEGRVLSSSLDEPTNTDDLDFGAGILSPQFSQLWYEFTAGVCLLQRIDLASLELSFEELLCIYLNLYHCLLTHAFLIIGPPASIFKWPVRHTYILYLYVLHMHCNLYISIKYTLTTVVAKSTTCV